MAQLTRRSCTGRRAAIPEPPNCIPVGWSAEIPAL
jgi:hypothetical protein